MDRLHVYGMCNPLFDLQAEVSDTMIERLGFEKGGMFLMAHEQQREVVGHIYDAIVNTEPGGSGANTMIGLAQLGAEVAYTGHIGADEHGRLYREGLTAKGIRTHLGESTGDTGICVVLISPDAQRTLCTYLGQCLELTKADINLDDLRRSEYLYVTGYLWDTEPQKEAVLFAMSEANKAGVKVALSLSDPFCVGRHKADFLRLIQDHVSVVMGNADEIAQLTDSADCYAGARALAPFCDLVAVTRDSSGSFLLQGDTLVEIPAYTVKAVDTTGAGDIYASGLLYGLVRGYSLEVSGRIASYIAGKCVAQLGPRLDALDLEVIAAIERGSELSTV